MEGYAWLYNREGKRMHANITNVYDEYKKNGWSVYDDFRDLEPIAEQVVPAQVETPVISLSAKKAGRPKRIK